jgi:hypothetical protein
VSHGTHGIDQCFAKKNEKFFRHNTARGGDIRVIGNAIAAITFDKLYRLSFARLSFRWRAALNARRAISSGYRWPKGNTGERQIVGYFLDDQWLNLSFVESIGIDHRVIAYHINKPWNPAGIMMNPLDRPRGEDTRASARVPKTIGDVFLTFTKGKRTQMMPQGYSLFQLPQLRSIQAFVQLRLPHEQNL